MFSIIRHPFKGRVSFHVFNIVYVEVYGETKLSPSTILFFMAFQDLCLSTIVSDFERYYEGFQTSQDPHMKEMLLYLQRFYSFELAQEMFFKGKLRRYTDFCMNKYLKILHTIWFDDDAPWESIVAKIAVIGPNLKEIDIYGRRPWEEIFCYLPNLEVMHCEDICNNEIISSLAKFCPNIIEIDIADSCSVTEEGFLSLYKKKNGESSCPKLKNLLLQGCEVTDAVAVHLIKNLPSLEVLDYDENIDRALYSMHKEDLHHLDKIPPYNLKMLNFLSSSRYPYFTDLLKVCSSVCPFVTNLYCCPILESQHLNLLSGFSHLKILHLECEKTYGVCLDINHFLKSSGNKLTSLAIRKCSLSVLILAESCPALEKLDVLDVNFDQLQRPIPLFHNLGAFECTKMELSDNNPDSLRSVCAILSSSPKLYSISFDDCHNLTAIELKTEIIRCCKQSCVKEIVFSFSRVEKPFLIDILFTCHSLEEFHLGDCGLDDHDKLEICKYAEILPNKPCVRVRP